jgi:dTDP-4-dehydrorhamnose reductase
MPHRVVVTGASGLLGFNFAMTAGRRKIRTMALYNAHPFQIPGIETVQVDLLDEDRTRRLIAGFAPDWIVHCAAATNVDWCQTHAGECQLLNVDLSRRMARIAREHDAGLVHISTDSVFDGTRGGYAEGHPAAPVNVYAASKLAGEQAVLEECERSMVVRTNFYGWNLQGKESLAEWVLHRLEAGHSVPGFCDIVFTPILANDLSEIILEMMARRLRGIFHVAGSQACSKYDFARWVAAEFGFDPGSVRRARAAGARKLIAPRPADTSLCTDKICGALGMAMPGALEGIRRFKELRDGVPTGNRPGRGGEMNQWPN